MATQNASSAITVIITFINTLKRFKKTLFIIASILAVYGLCLGVLAPWVIQYQAKKILQQRLDLQLDIKKLRINPFIFKIQITDLQLKHSNNKPLAGFDYFSIDFETISVLHWAWTLDHITLKGLHTQYERASNSQDTISALAAKWQASANASTLNNKTSKPPTKPHNTTSTTSLPRFLIRNIDLQLASVSLTDKVPATPFTKTVGPLDINIDALSTLPAHTGMHKIALTSTSGLEITWQGDIHLNPIKSQGHISIEGPYPVIASHYLQDTLAVAINSGFLKADLDYSLTQFAEQPVVASQQKNALTQAQSPFNVLLNNMNITLDDLKITERSSQKPLYHLEQFALSHASIQWPAQIIEVPKIAFNNGQIWLGRSPQGQTNIEQLLNAQKILSQKILSPSKASHTTLTATATATAKPKNKNKNKNKNQAHNKNKAQQNTPTKAWTISNKRFEINNWQVNIEDAAISTKANHTIKNIQLAVNDYQFKNNTTVNFEYGMALFNGRIAGKGSVIPMPFSALQTSTYLEQLALSPLQPYVSEFAKIAINNGYINGTIKVASDNTTKEAGFEINSDVFVDQLKISEATSQKKLLEWEQLAINAFNTNTNTKALAIKNITLNKPYIDFKINQNGTTSIDDILVKPKNPSTEKNTKPQQKTAQKSPQEQEQEQAPYHFKIGRIVINEGSSNFADASLPLPFATKIHRLNGGTSTLDTQSTASTKITLDGQLDDYGLLTIRGALTPFDLAKNSQINLKFDNINIPNLTPYSIKFAGRKIADGRLDLNLHYTLKNNKLQGKNAIVLRTFDLGQKVEHPGAFDLPLDLAIGLLKDNNQNITLNLPITGDINNPEFSITHVLGQALSKIITSAIASPFRLLAGLVGSETNDFGKVMFLPGQSLITSPQQESLNKLASAMQARPGLLLTVPSVYSDAVDAPAIKEQLFMQNTQAVLGYALEGDALTQQTTIKYFEKQFLIQKSAQQLQQLKAPFYTGENKKTFDTLAYSKALKEQLVNWQALNKEQLNALGQQRAESIKNTLVKQGITHQRITITQTQKLKSTKDEYVAVNLGVDISPNLNQ